MKRPPYFLITSGDGSPTFFFNAAGSPKSLNATTAYSPGIFVFAFRAPNEPAAIKAPPINTPVSFMNDSHAGFRTGKSSVKSNRDQSNSRMGFAEGKGDHVACGRPLPAAVGTRGCANSCASDGGGFFSVRRI